MTTYLDLHVWHRVGIASASSVHEFLQVCAKELKHLQQDFVTTHIYCTLEHGFGELGAYEV